MRALDLYCGGGGAAGGLALAGFDEIVGVDIRKQPEYPYKFIQGSALELSRRFVREFDFVWSSPPCQCYSIGTKKYRNQGKEYPDLVAPTRDFLLSCGVPFVMENVPGAPLRKDLVLCGEMFGLRVIRHRVFELHGFHAVQPRHRPHKLSVEDGSALGIYGRFGAGGFERQRKKSHYACVAGNGGDGYSYKLKDWQAAMGIDWINVKKTLTQCVPPAYSQYIAEQFLKPQTIDQYLVVSPRRKRA